MFPRIIKYYIKKSENKTQSGRRKEGSVHIEYEPKKKKKIKKDIGEYIKYEDIN